MWLFKTDTYLHLYENKRNIGGPFIIYLFYFNFFFKGQLFKLSRSVLLNPFCKYVYIYKPITSKANSANLLLRAFGLIIIRCYLNKQLSIF